MLITDPTATEWPRWQSAWTISRKTRYLVQAVAVFGHRAFKIKLIINIYDTNIIEMNGKINFDWLSIRSFTEANKTKKK